MDEMFYKMLINRLLYVLCKSKSACGRLWHNFRYFSDGVKPQFNGKNILKYVMAVML